MDERKQNVIEFIEKILSSRDKKRPETSFDMRFYVDFFETELLIRKLYDGRDEIKEAINAYYDRIEAISA